MNGMDTRIRGDADKSHKAIVENIDLLRQGLRELRGDVKELSTHVSRVSTQIEHLGIGRRANENGG